MIMPVSQIVTIALSLAGVVVALWLLITGVPVRARITGIIGTVLMLVGTLIDLTYRWALDLILGDEVSDATLIKTLAARTVIGSALTGAGLVLLTCTIIIAGGPRRREHAR